jgi:hypothetical protein
LEILPADRVVWGEALESATQSWTEVGGGWSATVLKEFKSDYWSQLVTFKDVQPGGVGVTCWYNDCCCLGMNHGACSGLVWLGRPAGIAVLWVPGRGTWRCAPAMGSHTSAMVEDPNRHWWWRRWKPWWCCWVATLISTTVIPTAITVITTVVFFCSVCCCCCCRGWGRCR